MSGPDVDFVLFDLGGVLIELGGVASLQELAGNISDEEVWHRWLSSPWVRRFERGWCSPEEFAVGVVTEWQLDLPPERFLEIFRDWPVGPFPGAQDLLAEVQKLAPIGCLSNTNTMHWQHQVVEWPMLGMFDFTFLSFELGLVKPDVDVFQAVADRLPVDRERVLFLDDVALNTEAAQSFGFRTARVRGIEESRDALAQVGLISQ